MVKNLVSSIILLAFAGSAMAAEPAPAVQITRDANYIYIKQPVRVTFDMEQQASLKEGITFLAGQLNQLNAVRAATDPNGDLKAISDSIKVMNDKLDLLVQVSTQLYGDIAPSGFQLFQALPSAYIVFAAVNADKNIFRFAQIGGSATLAAVLVPMRIEKVAIKTGKVVSSRIDWTENSAVVVIGLGLGGAQVSPTSIVPAGEAAAATQQANKSGRAGFGLVWGELNKASELVGLAGGGTVTVNLGVGVNAKFLGLKNWSKPSAVNNYILLVGVQRSAELKDKLPWTNIDAEFGANLGVIVDAAGSFSSAGKFISDVGAVITGDKKKDASQ